MNKAFVAAALAATMTTGCASLPDKENLDITALTYAGTVAQSVPVPSYTIRNLAPVQSPRYQSIEVSALFKNAKGEQYTMNCSDIGYNRIAASHNLNAKSWFQSSSKWKKFDHQLATAQTALGCPKIII